MFCVKIILISGEYKFYITNQGHWLVTSLLAFSKPCFTKLINKWKSNEMRNKSLNWRSTKETGIAEEWKISPTNESFPPVLPKMILRVVSWERLICFRSTCWPEKDCGPLPTPPITCHQNHQLLVQRLGHQWIICSSKYNSKPSKPITVSLIYL